jgi:hypothetical protein
MCFFLWGTIENRQNGSTAARGPLDQFLHFSWHSSLLGDSESSNGPELRCTHETYSTTEAISSSFGNGVSTGKVLMSYRWRNPYLDECQYWKLRPFYHFVLADCSILRVDLFFYASKTLVLRLMADSLNLHSYREGDVSIYLCFVSIQIQIFDFQDLLSKPRDR